MSRRSSPSHSHSNSHRRSNHTPDVASTTSFTPINIRTPSSAMQSLQLNTFVGVAAQESALRSTLNTDSLSSSSSPETPVPSHRGSQTLGTSSSLPSGSIPDAPIDPGVTTSTSSTSVTTVLRVPASFAHPVASLGDTLTYASAPQGQQAANFTNSTQDDDDEWMKYFPHNLNYDNINQDFTREQLVAYFNPDNYATIGIEDGDETEKRQLVAQFCDAAVQGWDGAATLDEGPSIEEDEEAEQIKAEGEDDEEEHEEAKKTKKSKVKEESSKINRAWDTFLEQFHDPLVKAAAKVGYLARKKIECLKTGKKFFVCRHGDGPGPGCLTNQYSSDRVRSAISNYFGRNKKQTKQIPNMMKWCRKHYQQDGYKDDTWQKTKKRHILGQLEQNEADLRKDGHSGLTYEIRLREKDEVRRREWKEQKGNKGQPTVSDKHPADLDVLQYIYDKYCDPGKTKEECKELVDWAFKDFERKSKEWCEGKDQKTINKDFKSSGPKFVEFQMLPEYKRFYSKQQLDIREALTPRKKPAPSTPSSKKTPKRGRKDRSDDSDDEYDDESPTKKIRKR